MTAVSSFPAVLFDYNGVLVDDEAVHLQAFQRVLAPLGIELTEADYWERYLGFDDVGAFFAILQAFGKVPTESEVRSLVEAKRPIYRELANAELQTFPGAEQLLRWFATRAIVGIVSGALRDEIELGLDVLHARDAVSFVISAEDTLKSKPAPDGYLLGQARVLEMVPSSAASQILVVEDSLAGVEAAKAAGLLCVGVGHSYTEGELRASGADAVVRCLADLTPELLARLHRSLCG